MSPRALRSPKIGIAGAWHPPQFANIEANRALGSGARCVASSSAAASLPVAEVTHTVSNEVATSRSLPARYPPRNASTTAAAIAKRLHRPSTARPPVMLRQLVQRRPQTVAERETLGFGVGERAARRQIVP